MCITTSVTLNGADAGVAIETLRARDTWFVVFSRDDQWLLYGSYFGGSDADHGRHVGIHPDGRFACIIGETGSKDLPLLRAAQSRLSGAFLVKFAIATE